jgi:hypothetical protein
MGGRFLFSIEEKANMDDELRDFFRNFKPPSAEQLALNAQEIGRLGKEVERISMHNYSNNAHASVDALALVWGVLLLAENLCLAGAPEPGQLNGLRVQLEALAWRLGDEAAKWP